MCTCHKVVEYTTAYREPSVVLINSYNEKLTAWKLSHPYDDTSDTKIEELEQMDLPFNSFASYVLHFHSSLYFRDLILTMRPISPWARSMRSIPFTPENIFLSKEYEGIDDDYLQLCMNEVYTLIEATVPVDYAKVKLPMAAQTEYTVCIDDRSLVTFLKTLRNCNRALYDVYGKLILDAIGKDDAYVTSRRCLDIYDKLSISPSEYDNVGKSTTCLESFVGVYRVANNLMAQFMRQHYSTVKNELWNKINHGDLTSIINERCDDLSVVAVYANINSFMKVISVRSCWFAQFDKESTQSWSSIIGSYVESLTATEFMNKLPCKGCRDACTIIKPMEDRINHRDVNPPCPILLDHPELIPTRKREYNSTSRVMAKWVDVYNEKLIHDDPSNRYRVVYESLLD